MHKCDIFFIYKVHRMELRKPNELMEKKIFFSRNNANVLCNNANISRDNENVSHNNANISRYYANL